MTAVIDRIRAEVEGHPVVLFMKGTPQFPMCGFSSRASEALKQAGAQLHSVNVLQDPEIRADLPRYSDWPTFPQLFINGEWRDAAAGQTPATVLPNLVSCSKSRSGSFLGIGEDPTSVMRPLNFWPG